MNIFKNYFKNRSIPFFISLCTAALCMISAIVYMACFYGVEHLEAFVSWIPTTFLFIGAVVLLGTSLVNLSQLGSAVMAGCSLVAFVGYVSTIYLYPVEQVMVTTIGNIPEFPAIIASAVNMLLCLILSNVCAWMRHTKKEKNK